MHWVYIGDFLINVRYFIAVFCSLNACIRNTAVHACMIELGDVIIDTAVTVQSVHHHRSKVKNVYNRTFRQAETFSSKLPPPAKEPMCSPPCTIVHDCLPVLMLIAVRQPMSRLPRKQASLLVFMDLVKKLLFLIDAICFSLAVSGWHCRPFSIVQSNLPSIWTRVVYWIHHAWFIHVLNGSDTVLLSVSWAL